jgi:hypothetical protein
LTHSRWHGASGAAGALSLAWSPEAAQVTVWSIGRSVDATAKLQALQMEREDDRHRRLIDSIDNVAQTVEDSSAFAQGKKLMNEYPANAVQ